VRAHRVERGIARRGARATATQPENAMADDRGLEVGRVRERRRSVHLDI